MSTLAEFSGLELIVPELQSHDAAGSLGELCSTLRRDGRVDDPRALYEAVIRRELLASTACAPGWALPHARLAGLPSFSFALGRRPEPLAWFGATHPVRLVFLFAVPEEAAPTYLTVVAALARLSQDSARVRQLLEAPDRESLLLLLDTVDLRAQRPASRPIALAH